MAGKVIIRQLWDKQKDRAPTLNDVDRSKLTSRREVEQDGSKYITYENGENEQPYSNGDQVTWVNLTEDYCYQVPTKFVRSSDGRRKRAVDYSRLVHDLHSLRKRLSKHGGDGYYNVYRIGGQNPPLQYFLKAWIYRKSDSDATKHL